MPCDDLELFRLLKIYVYIGLICIYICIYYVLCIMYIYVHIYICIYSLTRELYPEGHLSYMGDLLGRLFVLHESSTRRVVCLTWEIYWEGCLSYMSCMQSNQELIAAFYCELLAANTTEVLPKNTSKDQLKCHFKVNNILDCDLELPCPVNGK